MKCSIELDKRGDEGGYVAVNLSGLRRSMREESSNRCPQIQGLSVKSPKSLAEPHGRTQQSKVMKFFWGAK